jgi:F0F1-type ATP synthase membrane subunit b/b'
MDKIKEEIKNATDHAIKELETETEEIAEGLWAKIVKRKICIIGGAGLFILGLIIGLLI